MTVSWFANRSEAAARGDRRTPSASPSAATARRLYRAAGPLLFYLLIGIVLMIPYYPPQILTSPGGDLMNHVNGVVEAERALREGQFPIRVAPDIHGQQRYPFFCFYGNLPYTVAGAFALLPGVGPYLALRMTLGAGYVLAGWYAYRCALWLTRRPGAAMAAGAALVAAPYMFTDAHARAAFTEAVSFQILPACTYYTLRAFSRGRAGDVLACGAAWAALCLSHNLTFLFGGLFTAFFFAVALAAPRRRYLLRLARLAAAGLVALALAAWYLWPAVRLVPILRINYVAAAPPIGAELNPPEVLLSPVARTPIISTTAHLDLQYGVCFVAAAAVVLAALLAGCRPVRGRRRVAAGLLAAFAAAAVCVWSPDRAYWDRVPSLLWNLQSTSRLLIYTSMFGTLLLALALACMPRRLGRTLTFGLLAPVAVVALAGQSHVHFRERWLGGMEERAIASPNLGGNGAEDAYLLRPDASNATTPYHPDVNYALRGHGLAPEPLLPDAMETTVPTPPAGSTIELAGTMPAEYGPGAKLEVTLGGQTAASPALPPGPFRVALPLAPASPAGPTTRLRIDVARPQPDGTFTRSRGDAPRLPLSECYFRAPAGYAAEPLITADAARADARFGTRVRWAGRVAVPTLLQLPILHYPGLVEVVDDGRRVESFNVGPNVAVRLRPGVHRVRAEFVGTRWANRLSGAASVAWAGAAVWVGVRRVRTRRRRLPGRPDVPGPGRAILAAGVFGAVLMAPEGVRRIRYRLDADPPVTVEASRAIAQSHRSIAAAFDGDLTTAWSVDGQSPVTVTIRPQRPARLRSVGLLARWHDWVDQWGAVRFDFYRGGKLVRSYPYVLPSPHVTTDTDIELPDVEADRIDLTFSDPVMVWRHAQAPLQPGWPEPGYHEIRLSWRRD